jgi:putative addiction module killer protein
MKEIRETETFKAWFADFRNNRTQYCILTRIKRPARGNPGDVKPAGGGVSEMRIDYGPGYRVYFKDTREIIVLLCGGDKRTQTRDIERAKELLKDLEA